MNGRSAPTLPSSDVTDAEPSISLVVAAYNASRFLTSTLASVAGQTRPFDEIVVVDDGSTDDTAVLAAAWADRLPLRLERLATNGGLGAARRRGISCSSGSLVAILDADDILFPDHLETMLGTYREHLGIVTADAMWWSPTRALSRVSGRTRKKVPAPAQQRRGILRHNFVHPATLFARADYDRAGGFRDLRQMEDWDLWIRMIQSGVRVTMSPTPTVLYRIHEKSLSAGRANLTANVERLPEYLPGLPAGERRVLEQTIRRRRARIDLIAGERAEQNGRLGAASALWCKAVARDRNLRGGLTGGRSSVTVQALANIVTMGGLGRIRRARGSSATTGVRAR